MRRGAAIRPADPIVVLARELGELRDRVAALERLEACRRACSDARFVQVLAASTHGRCFSARELAAHARVDRALAAVLRSSTPAIGWQLRRVQDRLLGGLVVRRLGRDQAGVIWLVRHADAGHGAPGGA